MRNQADHKNRCTRESCRLNFKAQKASLIAAGVLKEALKSNGVDRLLEEFKSALMGLDLDATEVRRTGKYVSLVAEMLKGQPYACSDSAKGVEMLGGAEGGSDAAMNSAALNAVPRICEDMQLPFFMKLRSEEIIEDWARAGMPAIMPQTIAACAILRANDELIPHALRKGQSAASLPKVDVSNVALASGIAEGTILKQMKHPALPWPTTAVDDLSKSLRLGKELCVAARTKLDDWLQERDGRKRDWVRTTRPKLLAACALLVASREKARAEPGIIAPQLNVVAETIQDGDGQLAEAFGACPFASA